MVITEYNPTSNTGRQCYGIYLKMRDHVINMACEYSCLLYKHFESRYLNRILVGFAA